MFRGQKWGLGTQGIEKIEAGPAEHRRRFIQVEAALKLLLQVLQGRFLA